MFKQKGSIMEMTIKKWGNSLATRIPKAIAEMVDLNLNQKIDIEAKNGKIIIAPIVEKKEYTLDELLRQTPLDAIKLDDEDRAWLNDTPRGREW